MSADSNNKDVDSDDENRFEFDELNVALHLSLEQQYEKVFADELEKAKLESLRSTDAALGIEQVEYVEELQLQELLASGYTESEDQSDDFSNLPIILGALGEDSISTDCAGPGNNGNSNIPDESSQLQSTECDDSKLAEEKTNPVNEVKETENTNTNAGEEEHRSSDTAAGMPSESRSKRFLNIIGKTASAVVGAATRVAVLGGTVSLGGTVVACSVAAALHWAISRQAKEAPSSETTDIADKLTTLVAEGIVHSDVASLLNILSQTFLQTAKADVASYLREQISDLVEKKLLDKEISDFISLQTNDFEGYEPCDSTTLNKSQEIAKEYARLIDKGTLVPEFGDILSNIKMNYSGTTENSDDNSSEHISTANNQTPEMAGNDNSPKPDTLSPNVSSNSEECSQGAAAAIPNLRQDEISKELKELAKRGILQPQIMTAVHQQASTSAELAQYLQKLAENNENGNLHAQDAFQKQGNEMAKELEELVKRGHVSSQTASYLQENISLAPVMPTNYEKSKKSTIRENRWSTNSDDQKDNCKTEGQNDTLQPMNFSADSIPSNWSQDHLIEPGSDEYFKLVPLRPGEAEYDDIASDFSDGGLMVKAVERVQNCSKWRRFVNEMKEIQRNRSRGFNLNVKYLYHGTVGKKGHICEEGLDSRLSRSGFFGKGIYFSDRPEKCVQYCDQQGDGERLVFKCRVILGDTKVYPDGVYDLTLVREPQKENPSGGWRYHDSVKGCPLDYNEVVVYDNHRALVEYIIIFSGSVAPGLIKQLKPVSVDQPTGTPGSDKKYNLNPIDEPSIRNNVEVGFGVNVHRRRERGEIVLSDAITENVLEERRREFLKLAQSKGRTVNPLLLQKTSLQILTDIGKPLDEASGDSSGVADDEDDAGHVLSSQIMSFLEVTETDDINTATQYLRQAHYDMSQALDLYYNNML